MDFIDQEYFFSPIRRVVFIKHLSFVFSYADFITNLEFGFTGCPKSSFLYFIIMYFSTIGLGKQIKLCLSI